jgi:hypothetical protein
LYRYVGAVRATRELGAALTAEVGGVLDAGAAADGLFMGRVGYHFSPSYFAIKTHIQF